MSDHRHDQNGTGQINIVREGDELVQYRDVTCSVCGQLQRIVEDYRQYSPQKKGE